MLSLWYPNEKLQEGLASRGLKTPCCKDSACTSHLPPPDRQLICKDHHESLTRCISRLPSPFPAFRCFLFSKSACLGGSCPSAWPLNYIKHLCSKPCPARDGRKEEINTPPPPEACHSRRRWQDQWPFTLVSSPPPFFSSIK